jgi:hypothetical protein
MILRQATLSDFPVIDALYKEWDFTLDIKHIESIILVEQDGEVIAVGSIVRILEAAFLTSKSASKKQRVLALNKLVSVASSIVRRLGFDSYHSFATNLKIDTFLKKHFGFKDVNGKALIKWTGPD